jgi:hypothetical protein
VGSLDFEKKTSSTKFCESNDIDINNTLFEVLHYDFLFSIQGGGQVDKLDALLFEDVSK